ncbi:MAG: histidine kinase N-terminal domain-containing protein [Nocardioidaceae bacterium]
MAPRSEWRGFLAAAQIRPTTGPTAHVHDLVGSFVTHAKRPLLIQAFTEERIVREGDPSGAMRCRCGWR